MYGLMAGKRLRAMFAQHAAQQAFRGKMSNMKSGVKAWQMKAAENDDHLLNHLRRIHSSEDISKRLISGDLSHRFSIAGRRKVVAGTIRDYRKKYGSKETRKILMKSGQKYQKTLAKTEGVHLL